MFTAWVVPISLVTIVPAAFFGAVLSFIAVELMVDWLVESRHRCPTSGYVVVWVTFVAINLFGVELGMLTGIGAQMAAFIVLYSRTGTLLVQRFARSNVIRGFKQRSLTSQLRQEIITLELHGYVFFGSAVKIVETARRICFSPSKSEVTAPPTLGTPGKAGSQRLQVTGKQPRFLVLDLTHVTGLDSTGARAEFPELTICAATLDFLRRVYTYATASFLSRIEECGGPMQVRRRASSL